MASAEGDDLGENLVLRGKPVSQGIVEGASPVLPPEVRGVGDGQIAQPVGLGNTIRVGDLRFPVAARGGKAAT